MIWNHTQAMSKKIVEPNRKQLDMSKIYHAKFVAKASDQQHQGINPFI